MTTVDQDERVGIWQGWQDTKCVLHAVRANLWICALFAGAMWLMDQSHDAMRQIGEDWGTRWARPAYMMVGTAALSLALGFSSKNLLRRPTPAMKPTCWNGGLRRGTPYVLAALPWLVLYVTAVVAGNELVTRVPPVALATGAEPGTVGLVDKGTDGEAAEHVTADGVIWNLRWVKWAILGGGTVTLASGSGLVWAARRRGKRVKESGGPRGWRRWVLKWWTGGPVTWLDWWTWGIILTVAVMVTTAGMPWLPYVGASQLIGPLGIITAAAAGWCFLLNLLFAVANDRVPLVTLLILLGLVMGGMDCNDDHEVRIWSGRNVPAVTEAADALRAWLKTRSGYQCGRPYDVFFVAAEGGGIRNAYWTASVLSGLYDKVPGFGERLFAVSGVSGGSVGAAVYAALVRDAENRVTTPALLPKARQILSADLLSAVTARGMTFDLAQQFLPAISNSFDRAQPLEYSLEAAWHGAMKGATTNMGIGFMDLRGGAREDGGVPVLLLNTTDVATGRTVPVSHVRPDGRRPRPLMPTFHDLVLSEGQDIPLSTAAFLSARFPVVTPAGTVRDPSGGKRRFVDGGYFENSGSSTLLTLLQSLAREAVAEDVDRAKAGGASLHDVRAHVILITYRGRPTAEGGTAFGDPLSPLRAMMAAREARAVVGRDQLVSYLYDLPRSRAGCGATTNPAGSQPGNDPSAAIVFESNGTTVPVPLGWSLSASAKQSMDAQLNALMAAMNGSAPAASFAAVRQAAATGCGGRTLVP